MNVYKTVGGAPRPEQFLQADTPLHSRARAQRIIHKGHLFRMKILLSQITNLKMDYPQFVRFDSSTFFLRHLFYEAQFALYES